MARRLFHPRGPAPSALIAAALLALAVLAGCGDGGETTSEKSAGAGSGQGAETGEEAKNEPGTAGERETRQERDEAKGEAKPGADAETTRPAPTAAGSLPNEGTKEAAPGVPLVPGSKGGDNSVQTFGLEGPSEDRVEAARLLQAFVNARLNRRWALACSYLSDRIKAQMPALLNSDEEDEGSACVSLMKALGEGVPAKELRTAADIRVLSMRVEGDTAIVIYRDGDGAPSTIPMGREGGSWKVAAAAGSELFLGP